MMKEFWRERFHDGGLTMLALARWLAVGSLIGLVCGLAGGAFSHVLSWVTQTRQAHPWLLFCMPVAGLLIVWSYKVSDMENDSGTNQIIASVRSGEKPRLRLALLIFWSAALTHLTGGSAGREGAALQIGGSLAATLGKWLRLDERGRNLAVLCGMSALFTALFGTPLGATVFSLEVVSVGILHYSAFFPALFSALVSLGVTHLMGLSPTGWPLLGVPELAPLSLLQVGVLGAGCGLVAILFCTAMHYTADRYRRLLPNPYLRILVGAVLVIALTLVEGSGDYNGAGSAFLTATLAGEAAVTRQQLAGCRLAIDGSRVNKETFCAAESAKFGVTPAIDYDVRHLNLLLSLVESNQCVSIVPAVKYEELYLQGGHQNVVCREYADGAPEAYWGIAYNKRRPLNEHGQRFRAFVRDYFTRINAEYAAATRA